MRLTKTRGAGKPNARANGVAKPQLTSMVDMLTILLVFLLKSFSAEGNLVTPSQDLLLPESSSELTPAPTLNVEISSRGLNVDGTWLASLSEITEADSLHIPTLHVQLREIAELTGRADEENRVTIQCDRSVDFCIIKKVLFTCAKASFSDFSLLVLREE